MIKIAERERERERDVVDYYDQDSSSPKVEGRLYRQ